MPIPADNNPLGDDPQWYRDAVVYQLHVRSFADGNGDGIGDLPGLIRHLDYLQDLGATAVWLLPFYPSPLRDGGYDIADYTGVNPEYGTMRDFRRLIDQAHKRGLRVITEVVINHTSDQHRWFQKSREAKPGSRWRNYYVWSDTDDKYGDARIIFSDFESSNWTWDPVAGAYYWHRFYSHQPDLNFDNPEVHQAVFRVVDFWLGMGVDGLRLDAVPYLYEREGTTCENLPETHEFLKQLRTHVDEKFTNRMLLAEANQWPEDTRAYFGDGDGDECHMAFNFPVMPRMYMALQMEDRYPLVDIFEQTPEIPKSAQWALFLRNHDELTLEMVTDEERDYMYRVYATDPRERVNMGIRRRLAPLLDNDRRKIELLNGLLLSLPGTPIIYYGDEIGMGDNIYLGDRDGVRTPMQWTADRNAGFSDGNPQQLFLPVNIDPEYRYESVNVASQESNPSSLLVWMRRLIGQRQSHKELFGSGDLTFLRPDNSKVLCFLRTNGAVVLVVANLSRFSQYVELDLAEYRGYTPVEMSGQSRFPPIGDLPYLLTIGPYAFYWFVLEPAEHPADDGQGALPVIEAPPSWSAQFDVKRHRVALDSVLPQVLHDRRWFGGKARRITGASIVDSMPVSLGSVREFARILFVEVHYADGEPETYVLPVTFLPLEYAEVFLEDHPGAGLVRLMGNGDGGLNGVLCDAMFEELFTSRLLDSITNRRRMKSIAGELRGITTKAIRDLADDGSGSWPQISKSEQSNTSVMFGNNMIFKLFRRSEPGPNPDWELGRFLTESAKFANSPKTIGALEYRDSKGQSRTLGVLSELVEHETNAWEHALHQLGGYLESLPAIDQVRRAELRSPGPIAGLTGQQAPDLAHELFGPMLQNAELLGQRTAQMHLALASDTRRSEFKPETFNPHHQRSAYQSIRNQVLRSLGLLRGQRSSLGREADSLAEQLLASEDELVAIAALIKDNRLLGPRMRIHGDYHLGQVLFTGRDFVIIDFEGEPAKPLSVRRFKRSPLRDVAGMLRSMDYAAMSALASYEEMFNVRREAGLELTLHGAQFWSGWVGSRFLSSYMDAATELYNEPPPALANQLQALLLDKACYELEYELNHRPDWVTLPMRGLLDLLG